MPGRYDTHPEMQPLIDARAAQKPATTLEDMRAVFDAAAAAVKPPRPDGLEVQDSTMPRLDGQPVPVRIYRPKGLGKRAPCVVYIHGGGFMKGSPETSDSTGWGLAVDARAVCVSVDYRLAPEHKHPDPFDDCYGVVAHIAAHAADLGIDASRIAVAGDSAGGCLTAAVCLAARDRAGPAIAAQVLVYPCLTDDLSAPSFAYNADPPGLTTASMKQYWDWYLGEGVRSNDPYATPACATDLSRLPPTFVVTAEYDPLYNDGFDYARRLKAAGVPVTYRCAARFIHGFLRLRDGGPAARAEFAALTGFLRQRLGS
ncbi:MAG: alpha/beta hydrolase [Alphaproteobacteria bacterium]|nr:alpha/beta hydrolase [Alphaproteobacteria bacterium]MCB9929335.1 alpha/beta hydrolase [Alphaproteobacteria bacterium]